MKDDLSRVILLDRVFEGTSLAFLFKMYTLFEYSICTIKIKYKMFTYMFRVRVRHRRYAFDRTAGS